MDVVVGAVDNRLARYHSNLCCSMFAIPHIDDGMQELRGSVSAFKSTIASKIGNP
jgi:molybdopterin/thiamine biosynthesis adenylyltransferase